MIYCFFQAFNDLEELLDQNDICIAIKERLTKDSGIALDSSYDNIVRKLVSKQNARGKTSLSTANHILCVISLEVLNFESILKK